MTAKTLHGFSFRGQGILDRILTPIRISKPLKTHNFSSPPAIEVYALWDTGATACVVTPSAARKLNLTPVAKTRVRGFRGVMTTNLYILDVYLYEKHLQGLTKNG